MPVLAQTVHSYRQLAGDHACILVNVDQETPAQYVVDLLNLLSEKNIRKVSFSKPSTPH